jgi:hypothetical protein
MLIAEVMSMKKLLCLLMVLGASHLFAQNTTLADKMNPEHYLPHQSAKLNVLLVYYGTEFDRSYLERITPLLEERFYQAADHLIELKVVKKLVLPYKFMNEFKEDFEDYPHVVDEDARRRLWYVENVRGGITTEVYKAIKSKYGAEYLKDIDNIGIITGAQFNGQGLTFGRVSVTENPREIAWGKASTHKTLEVNDYQVVDVLIHEIGHGIWIHHTSKQCMRQKDENLNDFIHRRKECCATSPSKNDIMSYCRSRSAVSSHFYNKFEACNIGKIENHVIPSLLKGGVVKIPNEKDCE